MIQESPAQAARRATVQGFFATTVLRKSSVGAPVPPISPRPQSKPKQGGKTINQANGGTLILKDCEGNELHRLKRIAGIEGEQEVRVGCDDSSSGSMG